MIINNYNINNNEGIRNVVSTFQLNQKINLKYLSNKIWNIEYNPLKFTSAILRQRLPTQTTALVFSSGRVVCTGAKSVLESKRAARAFARKIQKIVPGVKFTKFKVQNIVSSYSVGYHVNIQDFYYANLKRCKFEQENFPGLKLKLCNTDNTLKKNAIAIIFYSGKFVLTGFTDEEEIDDKKNYLKRILLRYKK